MISKDDIFMNEDEYEVLTNRNNMKHVDNSLSGYVTYQGGVSIASVEGLPEILAEVERDLTEDKQYIKYLDARQTHMAETWDENNEIFNKHIQMLKSHFEAMTVALNRTSVELSKQKDGLRKVKNFLLEIGLGIWALVFMSYALIHNPYVCVIACGLWTLVWFNTMKIMYQDK